MSLDVAFLLFSAGVMTVVVALMFAEAWAERKRMKRQREVAKEILEWEAAHSRRSL